MSGNDPKSWIDQLGGFAMGILFTTIALYCAVAVLRTILPFLIVTLGVLVLVGGIAAVVIRTLRNRW